MDQETAQLGLRAGRRVFELMQAIGLYSHGLAHPYVLIGLTNGPELARDGFNLPGCANEPAATAELKRLARGGFRIQGESESTTCANCVKSGLIVVVAGLPTNEDCERLANIIMELYLQYFAQLQLTVRAS